MLRKLQYVVTEQALWMVYFSYYQSQLEYGIIFGGSSLVMKSLFVAQKRVIKVMLKLSPRSSCREGFKRLGILTVPSLYIYIYIYIHTHTYIQIDTYSILMFVVRNCNSYQTNNNIHHIYTRQVGKLHVSSVRLSSIQRGMLNSSIMVYNNLLQNIQILSDNVKIFKCTLKNSLISNAFYSTDKYISARHV
jgi:hypothetical protein